MSGRLVNASLVIGAITAVTFGCSEVEHLPQPGGVSESLVKNLSDVIDTYPENARQVLRKIVLDPGFVGVISQAGAQEIGAALSTGPRETAMALVNLARVYAKAPISNFSVGAVAIGSSKALYLGCNLEFLDQPLSNSVHGEQSAVMNAWVHGETGLEAVAITAAPCGYCRQFLNELSTADNLMILLKDSPAVSLLSLLPKAFGPVDLGMHGALMLPEKHALVLAEAERDVIIAAALIAASASYAPYSQNFAGVALESSDGVVVAGRQAENAAYNPSMSPMQAALAVYNLTGRTFEDIKRAVLVQGIGAPTNQEEASRAVLRSINGWVSLESYHATAQ